MDQGRRATPEGFNSPDFLPCSTFEVNPRVPSNERDERAASQIQKFLCLPRFLVDRIYASRLQVNSTLRALVDSNTAATTGYARRVAKSEAFSER